jgi:hypothetical protein
MRHMCWRWPSAYQFRRTIQRPRAGDPKASGLVDGEDRHAHEPDRSLSRQHNQGSGGLPGLRC